MNGAANLPLLGSVACLGGIVVAMVDGRHAVPVALLVAAASLAPTAAVVTGPLAGMLVIGVAVTAVVAGGIVGLASRHLHPANRSEPAVPRIDTSESLFGPRSMRAAGAALMLPTASWVSFNIPVGLQTTVSGLLFPAAYVGLCALLRIFMIRRLEDFGIGFGVTGIAGATTWLLRSGSGGVVEALLPAALAVLAALGVGWFGGRNRSWGVNS